MSDDELRTRTGLASDLRRTEQDTRWQEGWREFDQKYGPLLLGFARKQGLSEADALDVRQEIFVALKRALPSYDRRKGRFRTFLLTIAYRKIVDHLRAANRTTTVPLESVEPVASPDVERMWEAEWTRAVQEAGFQKLRESHPRVEERTWQMARELFVRGRTPAEVATRHQAKPKAVHKVTEKWERPFAAAMHEVAVAWGDV